MSRFCTLLTYVADITLCTRPRWRPDVPQ